MRTLLAALVLLVCTLALGSLVLLMVLLRVPSRPGGIYEKAPRWWAKAVLFASGTTVRVHGAERLRDGRARIFIANHVSWYDVLALAATLPRYKFIGKSELTKVPLFGPAAVASGMIPIERENRKAAFGSYREAAQLIRDGVSVIVFPEGTRGEGYELRPFKKGPFVLAAEAGVPIVPTIIYGSIEVLPRGSLNLRAGTIDIHLLEPVSTAGRTYEDRDALARETWDRMADALSELYGVESRPPALPAAANGD
jgi:1-acyl-sn-glycerol-3-phosphate acyltransferase